MAKDKAPCPFCKPNDDALRGEGCCNCDHTGLVPVGEAFIFKTMEEATTHDPEVSYADIRYNRAHGLPVTYKPDI